jgi:two-component system sensor histidine kinase KdpD
MFSVMRDQAARLNRLVREVLSLASVESGDLALNLEPLSVMPVVDQAIQEMTARDGGRFHRPYAPVLPLVMADRDRIMEVLVNLLDNADKYSPPDAKVQIEVRPTETEVILSVLDFGPGLPERNLERVFDKFYRAEAGDSQRAYGYGLGLYICRRLVEAQGGRIWATNRPGGGASFSFALPVAAQLIRH